MNAQKPVNGGHTALYVGNLDPSVTDVFPVRERDG